MSQNFQPGDFLVFQIESGFALLRLLEIDKNSADWIWHVSAYQDLFFDIETAEAATLTPLKLSDPHIALTTRAFESTQVARISNKALTDDETAPLNIWKNDPEHQVSDRSVRLMLGLR